MQEKIAVRIAEVNAWGDLAGYLDRMTSDAQRALESNQQCLKEKFPDGGEGIKDSWEYSEIKDYQAKLTAYDSIRATILKAMG
jgi:hypothetical protein